MRKRSLFVAAVLTALLAGLLPVGDACALPQAANHECCAEPSPALRSSCCAENPDTSESDTHPGAGICDCVHPSPTPVTATTASISTDTETGTPVPAPFDTTLLVQTGLSRTLAPESRVRSHAPPPVFLLDCAFLI